MTTRPTPPAILNSSNLVAQQAKGVWLVDADTNVPDLEAIQPTAVRSGSPPYSTAGVLGGHFTGTGSAYVLSSTLASPIAAYPFYVAAKFTYTGTAGGAMEIVGSLDSTTSDIVAAIAVSDGTFGTAGHLVGFFRVVNGGDVSFVDNGPAVVSGTDYTVALKCVNGDGEAGSGIMVVNDTAYSHIASGAGAFGSDTFNNAAMLSAVRSGTPLWTSSSNVDLALLWIGDSGTSLTQSDLITWASDPWAMLSASSSATLLKCNYIVDASVSKLNNIAYASVKSANGLTTS